MPIGGREQPLGTKEVRFNRSSRRHGEKSRKRFEDFKNSVDFTIYIIMDILARLHKRVPEDAARRVLLPHIVQAYKMFGGEEGGQAMQRLIFDALHKDDPILAEQVTNILMLDELQRMWAYESLDFFESNVTKLFLLKFEKNCQPMWVVTGRLMEKPLPGQ